MPGERSVALPPATWLAQDEEGEKADPRDFLPRTNHFKRVWRGGHNT
jgi:hypothetical protein